MQAMLAAMERGVMPAIKVFFSSLTVFVLLHQLHQAILKIQGGPARLCKKRIDSCPIRANHFRYLSLCVAILIIYDQ
jgi:hypothetical protein